MPWAAEQGVDDKYDDNPEDSRPPNYGNDFPKTWASSLVMPSAWSWQCGGQGFESIELAHNAQPPFLARFSRIGR